MAVVPYAGGEPGISSMKPEKPLGLIGVSLLNGK
jgi:hypothetical protein